MEEKLQVHFKLNGQPVEAVVSPKMTLIDFLRHELRLTSVKNGCDQGHCGTCTIILDGKAQRSCLVKMSKMGGREIETIESLEREGKLHVLQAAFIQEGAVQCGFCTPGAIMTAKALLNENLSPTEEDIKQALKHNLCRCTGYNSIIHAVNNAAELLRSGVEYVDIPMKSAPDQAIGARLFQKSSVDHVLGRTKYGDDYFPEDMLVGKVLWSDYAHAEIVNIDTQAAAEMPGVVLVLTGKDVPGVNKIGILVRDQPAIAADRVRMIGDPVAVVFANTEAQAEEALSRIKVEYRPLPGVFTPEDAAAPGAPAIHDKGNLLHEARLDRGDVDQAFAEAAVVYEQTYTTPFIEHAFLEPESGTAYPDRDGGVTVKIGTQAAFDDRAQLSEALALPVEKVRIVQIPMGGAFGGKEDIILHFFLALGALRSKRPVKMTLTRPESLRTHPKRHAATMHYKTAMDAEGRLTAVEAHTLLDTGAYASLGADILENMLTFGAGPYYVPNLRLEAKAYYTNNITGGAMRGFGVPQVAFALESNLDAMIRSLGLDPLEVRYLNALDVGLPLASGHVLEASVGIKETIRAVQEKLKSIGITKNGKKIGIGVASSLKNIGYGHGVPEDAGAIVELTPEGTYFIRVGLSDFGQGALQAMSQIAAQVMNADPATILVQGADTRTSPPTGPTTASRQTVLTGNAIVMACEKLKQQILKLGEEELRLPVSELTLTGNKLVHTPSGQSFRLAGINTPLSADARYRSIPTVGFEPASDDSGDGCGSRRTHWSYSYATHAAVVEVDEKTGKVKVQTFIAAHDVGRAINPQIIEGQIEGGVMMGIGFALSEEFVVENGINLTDTLYKCHIPTIEDAPQIIPIVVEDPDPQGPFGAKGLAEVPTLPVAAAVVNAIYDAVGVRITSLPAKRQRVLAAIQSKETLS